MNIGFKNKLRMFAVIGLAALVLNCGDINGSLTNQFKQ